VLDYGSANAIEESNMQAVGWCLDSWTLGSDGVVPWQTIGKEASWQQADPLSLFYPGSAIGQREPAPSIRLKAFRRGQQDAEYLTLFAQATGQPRWAVGETVRQALGLKTVGESRPAAEADAATVQKISPLPQDVWAVRTQIGRALSALKPPAKRQLIDLRTPPRNVPARAAYVGQ
jgi:hypothetical protein